MLALGRMSWLDDDAVSVSASARVSGSLTSNVTGPIVVSSGAIRLASVARRMVEALLISSIRKESPHGRLRLQRRSSHRSRRWHHPRSRTAPLAAPAQDRGRHQGRGRRGSLGLRCVGIEKLDPNRDECRAQQSWPNVDETNLQVWGKYRRRRRPLSFERVDPHHRYDDRVEVAFTGETRRNSCVPAHARSPRVLCRSPRHLRCVESARRRP